MLHTLAEGFREVAAEVKNLVLSKAEGNPFFMEELTLELLESGLMSKEGKVCRLVEPGGESACAGNRSGRHHGTY